MKIAIDARLYGPEGTGIGRYVEKLLENLELLDQKNKYFVFLRTSNFHLYNPKNPNFTKIKADARWYSVKEQVIMPAILVKERLDLVHFPHFNVPLLYPGKFVVTIHDLTKSNFSSSAASTKITPVYLTKQNMYKLTLRQAVTRAKIVFTPSQYVKTQLVTEMRINEKKIAVTPEGANEFYEPQLSPSEGKIKEVFGKYSVKAPYIIFVGNTYPYKNIKIILEELARVPTDLKFVCVSPRNTFLDRVIREAEELGVRSRLIATGFVPDEELKVLLNQALCFVFPSLSEGFGLPGLEAMGVGCPVIAAKATSLPEVYGEAAIYFDPKDSKELALKINALTKDTKLRNNMIALGYQQVRKYSWKKMAEETLKVYNLVLEQNN